MCLIRLHNFSPDTFQSDKYLISFVLEFLTETRDALRAHLWLKLSQFKDIQMEGNLFLNSQILSIVKSCVTILVLLHDYYRAYI